MVEEVKNKPWVPFLLTLVAIPAWASPGETVTLSRPLAMGDAYRAAGAANGAIYSNPAGISRLTLYSVEWSWLRGDRTGGDDDTFHLSVVDTKTQPIGVGAGYSYVPGETDRHDARMAIAYPIVPGKLHAGSAFRYIVLDPEKGDSASGLAVDTGLVAELGAGLMFGLTAHNALPDKELGETSSRSWGTGLAYEGRFFSIASDLVYDPSATDDHASARFSYHAGTEYMVSQNLPLRLGWDYRPVLGDGSHRLAVGVGWVTKTGALDFAYRQRINGEGDRSFALGLRSFF
jgi:opacity protein-like surface antigen